MDRTGIIVISLCVALLGVWLYEQNEFAKKQQAWLAAHPTATSTNSVATAGATATATSGTSTTPIAPVIFDTNAPEQTLVLTNGHARYTFTSRGGGLKLIELMDYPETVSARWRDAVHNSGKFASLNTQAAVPVLAVLGDASLVGDGNFVLTPTATGVRADKTLAGGLVISKQFSFSSNYLVNADVTLQNTSDQPLLLPPQEFVVGTATPMDVDDANAPQTAGALWHDGTNTTSEPLMYFQGASGASCSRALPHPEYRTGAANVVWAAAHNQFFAMLAMPKQPAVEMVARSVPLPRFQDTGAATNGPLPMGVQTAMVFPGQTLTANSSAERQIVLFAGPKEFRTLAAISDEYKNNADQVMNFGSGFATFWGVGTFFAKLLLSGMNAIHDVTRIGYGWSIVVITILIRALFWPLTAASTRSMKRMQALQPEVNALKEKYKDDQQKLMQKQMELWKQHGVSPMSGCWPMMIQMPVFFGFFTMIRSAIELRGASFLWASDLSKPDTLFMIPGITFLPFNLSTPEGLPFNLLPLMMVSVMLWQSHLTPPSPGMDPAQQKMMRWLPGIFILFLYNYSSGLALYMTVSTLASVIQTKLTKNLKDPALKNAKLAPATKSKK
ncbi:MAG TPA: membrane protein insertase YidC [Candidatus Sulfotelmatobacter sp.]|nr:membrane protein insertase YidC [Candidatus Sulfotelmatobacter sp.]